MESKMTEIEVIATNLAAVELSGYLKKKDDFNNFKDLLKV